MSTMIDIVGSMIVGGLVMLAILKLDTTLSETSSDTNVQVITQTNLTAITSTISDDFYKIGFRASPGILFADTSTITFLADLEKTGTPDTVHYWISAPIETDDLNPNMRVLYRSVDGQTATGATLGQTSFRLTYFDSSGAQIVLPAGGTSDPGTLVRIKSIEIAVEVESPTEMISDTTYAGSFWEAFISPKNLRTLM